MKLILTDFMSLDGVVQAPGGEKEDTDGGFAHGGWSIPYFDPETMGPFVGGLMAETSALLYGRRTWQGMAAAWPERAGDPFADWMNGIDKYVASRSLTQDDLTWNGSKLLPADGAVRAVAELREQSGGYLEMWGSPSFAAELIEADLVDEYRVLLEPILLGGGKGIWPTAGSARPLELVSADTAGTGVVMLHYRRVRD
ncbi:MAG: dihydrofolate reductase family protein [Patulibacter minatonensis]